MWKISLVLVCALAACSGGSSGSAPGPYPAVSVQSLSGRTFLATGPQMQAFNGYDVPTQAQVNVQFVSADQINVNGVSLKKDPNDGVFRSADKSLQLTVSNAIDGLGTNQMMYMLSQQTVSGTTSFTPLVVGNATTTADLPQSGTAVYAGKMTLFDDLGNKSTTAGPTLLVNLDTANVTGSFTFANRFVQLDTATLNSGSFSTTVKSGETTPEVTGTIDGKLYGAAGAEAGGTLALQFSPAGSPSASYVGYYGATKQ